MKFALVDKVIELEPERRIVAIKAISRSEEYLGDHFPTFPVLPGVFMLQVLVESATWLVRASGGFDKSVILLKEAKNVIYKSFVKPGQILRAEVTCNRLSPEGSDFSGTGRCGDTEVVKARFSLTHFNLADRHGSFADMDARIRDQARGQWRMIGPAEHSSASQIGVAG